MSSIGGMFYSEFCAGISLTCGGIHQCRDVITFCLYLLNKKRRNLIKIRPCAIFSWFNQFYRFVLIFRPVNVMVFDWLFSLHVIDPTSTTHSPYIDPTSTLHRSPYIYISSSSFLLFSLLLLLLISILLSPPAPPPQF